ncbi:MAG: hypothetical protein IJF41_00315 [Clostridia bacterium]|nr:hypothetical protein [Clostridia bacterium]
MCNIAGYAGTKAAAPILIEMMRRQEGLCGGYYSGLATIHEGKLYYAKLTGDMPRLEALTNAASLPGTVGIIHSRSNSGGGDAWSHPFVAEAEGVVRSAYVANGAMGCFEALRPQANALTEELLKEGYAMQSRELTPIGDYPTLSDGSGVHMSDAMCQLITRSIDGGMAADDAMEKAFCRMPSEIVGLLLSLTEPEGIAWSRINMPMMLAFAEHGAYLASSAMGIPEDAREPIPLPPCACGMVYRDSYTVKPFKELPCTVAPVTAQVRKLAYDAMCQAMKKDALSIGPLQDVVEPFFPKADCVPVTLVVYDVLLSLREEGRLKWECRRLPGAREDLDAPKLYFSLAED